jgi:hypothetical protein
MGALSKAAEEVGARHQGPSCTVGLALAAMDDDDRGTFLGWIHDGRQWSWIARVLAQAGVRISDYTLRRHFDGRCRCDG